MTVTADPDSDARSERGTITPTPTRGGYDGVDTDDIVVVINDDETPAVMISDSQLDIDEGESDTYTVVLLTQPAADVTVTVNPPADIGVSVNKDTLTFTQDDWNILQTVTVRALHDDDALDESGISSTPWPPPTPTTTASTPRPWRSPSTTTRSFQ